MLVSLCTRECVRAHVDHAIVPLTAAHHGVVASAAWWQPLPVWPHKALKSARKGQKRARKDKISPACTAATEI